MSNFTADDVGRGRWLPNQPYLEHDIRVPDDNDKFGRVTRLARESPQDPEAQRAAVARLLNDLADQESLAFVVEHLRRPAGIGF